MFTRIRDYLLNLIPRIYKVLEKVFSALYENNALLICAVFIFIVVIVKVLF